MSRERLATEPASTEPLDEHVDAELRRALAEIRHGSITLIVQDGRVVQIDATHKVRLDRRRTRITG